MTLDKRELLKIVGTQCGKLTIIEYLGFYARNGKRNRHWFSCKCSCGKMVEVDFNRLDINKSRTTTSCGCSRTHSTHGCSKHGAYNNYKAMIGRVKRPPPSLS